VEHFIILGECEVDVIIFGNVYFYLSLLQRGTRIYALMQEGSGTSCATQAHFYFVYLQFKLLMVSKPHQSRTKLFAKSRMPQTTPLHPTDFLTPNQISPAAG